MMAAVAAVLRSLLLMAHRDLCHRAVGCRRVVGQMDQKLRPEVDHRDSMERLVSVVGRAVWQRRDQPGWAVALEAPQALAQALVA